MPSPDNHEATARFFADHGNFGLEHVRCFVQGRMPAVDRETGRVLLAAKDHVALSPDGHGGTLTAPAPPRPRRAQRKSTRLKSSHHINSYSLFFFKKKKKKCNTRINRRSRVI